MNDVEGLALETGLANFGLNGRDDADKIAMLERYIDEIQLWNPQYGLIAPGEDLIGRHILDSLSGLAPIRDLSPRHMADIGSGAGFPGIPLAIWLPGCEVSLVERMGRRAGFLRTVAVGLGLKNVKVVEKPVEEIREAESRFDVVTFRAWSAIDDEVLDSMETILAPGGTIAAYKGRRDVIETELSGVENRVFVSAVLPLPSTGEGERNLVLLKLK